MPKLTDRLAQRGPCLGQLARSEDQQGDDQDDEQMCRCETAHGCDLQRKRLVCPPTLALFEIG